MSRSLKNKITILKTVSTYSDFYVVTMDFLSKETNIFNYNHKDEFIKYLKDSKYVVGFDIKNHIKIISCWMNNLPTSTLNVASIDIDKKNLDVYAPYRYDFHIIDLKKMHRMDKRNISIEYAGANVNSTRISKNINKEDISSLINNSIIDIEIMFDILSCSIDMILARKSLSIEKKYYMLDMSPSKIADVLLIKEIIKKTGLTYEEVKSKISTYSKSLTVKARDIIHKEISFVRRELNDVLEDLSDRFIDEIKDRKINLFNKPVIIKSGGVHTIDNPCVYSSDKDKVYISIDGVSFYASVVNELGIHPRSIDKKIFIDYINNILKDRSDKNCNEDKSKLYKDILTATIGKFRSENSILYDPIAYQEVIINAQMIALMIIEELESNGYKTIYVNTDEVVVECSVDKSKDIGKIIDVFNMSRIDVPFRISVYNKFIVRNSTDTIRVSEDGSIKRKGFFDYSIFPTKKLHATIIPKAVEHVLLNNGDIDEFFKENTNIKDYIFNFRDSNTSDIELNKVVNGEIQKVNIGNFAIRFYVSNNKNSFNISCISNDGSRNSVYGIKNKINICGYLCDEYPDDINIDFYKKEAIKIINEFNEQQLSIWS